MSNFEFAQRQLQQINNRIANACNEYGRSQQDVRLIGASKKQDVELLQHFADAGLKDFGENYLQEGVEKIEALAKPGLTWHFIGAIQSRKAKEVAANFNWVHSIDRIKVAKGLDKAMSELNQLSGKLNVLVQLNLDAEPSKAGVTADQLDPLVVDILELSHLQLRGFMLIPKPRENAEETRAVFEQARGLLESSNKKYDLQMDQLSMGMSSDLELAIAEGSTMIRVGTDLFGARGQ